MSRTTSSAILALATTLCTLCAAPTLAARGPSSPTQTAIAEETATFAGAWDTTFGLLVLEQNGELVTGSYRMADEDASVTGEVEARRLTFTYREVDASGVGWFELAEDGRSFAGEWKEDGEDAWSEWIGDRAEPTSTDASPGFAGLWQTSYGGMRLFVDGTAVRGTYAWAAGSTIAGTLEGDRLRFEYTEPDGITGRGEFTLAPDGSSFTGTWSADAGGGGEWTGTRVAARPGRAWLVILEAHWEDGLSAPEYSYGEMLRAYFTRLPHIEVRHRFVHDIADLRRFCRELTYIAEPVVLYVSSHGTEEGVSLGSETADAATLIECLRDVPELRLLHFGSCLVLNGDVPRRIDESRPASARFPISGFARTADWGGSAITDFTYLELVLGRGMRPHESLDWTRRMVSFARADEAGPIPGSDLRLYERSTSSAGILGGAR